MTSRRWETMSRPPWACAQGAVGEIQHRGCRPPPRQATNRPAMVPLRLIHLSAWKDRSPEFASGIPHSPGSNVP